LLTLFSGTEIRDVCGHCHCNLRGVDAKNTIDCRTGGRGCGVRFCKKECYLAMLTSKVHVLVCPKLQELLLLLEKKKFRADRDTHSASLMLVKQAGQNKSNKALVWMLAADTMVENGAAEALFTAALCLKVLSALDLALTAVHIKDLAIGEPLPSAPRLSLARSSPSTRTSWRQCHNSSL
jgi:hypothetical protein